MYALTFCYEGGNNIPYATTIAVSEDKNKLVEEMNKCVEEDMREPDEDDGEDEYSDTCNWEVCEQYELETLMQHKTITDLYGKYTIRVVTVL